MKNFIILFLLFQISFSQSQTTLEDKIYYAVDNFVANPTQENLKNLSLQEKTFSPKSKPELLAFVILKCNKAFYENQFGQTQNAIKSYETAWQIFDKNKLSNYDIIESCLKPLGNLYAVIGDYTSAENTIKQYYFIANQTRNANQIYASILNLSNVYQNTGRIEEAIFLLEKTLKTEKLSDTQKGILYNNLGNNYFLSTQQILMKKNAFSNGENAYKKAISLFQKDKSQAETLSNAYRNLANRYAVTQQFDLANQFMEKARELFFMKPNNEPRKTAKLYVDMANLDFHQKDFQATKINLDAAFSTLLPNFSKSKLPNSNSLFAETVLLDAFDLQAELFLAQNQTQKALESYALSFHVEELLQAMILHEDSKIITQIRNRNRTEKCIAIYFDLYKKEKKNSYLEKAFLLAEQTKSAILQQEINNNKTASKEEKLIKEQLQNWSNVISKEQQKLDYADISKINEAIKKQNELVLLLKSKESKESKKSKKQLLLLNDLYSKLEKDKAVLVEYFYGKEELFVFTIKDKKIQIETINITDTAIPKIVQFIDLFSQSDKISNNVSDYNHYGFSIYEMLKIPKKSDYKNLIIIPDGILNFLPFEALITNESSTTNFAKMHYLLNDYIISYNNSANFYLNSVEKKQSKETVLGIFPVFKNSYLELTFSVKEMHFIQNNFDGKYLENQNATFSNFKKNAPNYSILHLSTHASSGDFVEPASIKFYDQEVLYSELYNLQLNPNLVVLSACETGIGKLYKAEGAMSVARGFQFAGAQNLLFSLWKVNDYTTSVFMENFYKNLKNGKSYSEANHQAKLDFLKNSSIPNAKKSPYYWSAFVYYGTLEDNQSNNTAIYFSIAFGVVLLILFLSFRRRRNLIK